MHSKWARVCDLKDGDGNYPFKSLGEVMLAILAIFHANADCERIFSMHRKVKGEMQGNFGMQNVNARLQSKTFMQAMRSTCYEFHLAVDLLRKCKVKKQCQVLVITSSPDS